MKLIAREVLKDGEEVTIVGGCVSCEADLVSTKLPVLRVEMPWICPSCGKEMAVTILNRETAGVRLPYGCSAWFDVRSSNLSAIGRAGSDLLVRFKKGGVYKYAAAGKFLKVLISADSAGKAFNTRVKPLGGTLLCAKYGCVESPDREANQVICDAHLSHRS